MDQQVAGLQDQLEKLANDARGDAKDAARKLDEAAGSITDKRVREKIRYTKNTLQGQASEYARAMEQDIQSNLEGLQNKIGEAQAAFGQADKQDALGRADDKSARSRARHRVARSAHARPRAAESARAQWSAGPAAGSAGSARTTGPAERAEFSRASSRASKGNRVSRASRVSKANRASRVSRVSKANRASKVSPVSRAARAAAISSRRRTAAIVTAAAPTAARYGGGYWNGGRWVGGYYDPNDIRQFRNEIRAVADRRRSASASELQSQARAARRISIRRSAICAASTADKAFVDPANLAALQAAGARQAEEVRVQPAQEGRGRRPAAVALRFRRSAGRLPHVDRGVLPRAREEAVRRHRRLRAPGFSKGDSLKTVALFL